MIVIFFTTNGTSKVTIYVELKEDQSMLADVESVVLKVIDMLVTSMLDMAK